MAAVPWRIDALERSVSSIIEQVDCLNIYLNGWKKIPPFLINKKINAVLSQNEVGDLGAKGKFYWCEKVRGYHLTIDDDIIYPKDYVSEIIHQLSRYPRAVVSYHGSILNHPDFKKRNNKLTHFARKCFKDTVVTFVGTGVLAYNTYTTKIKLSGFKSNHWADGWFSLQVRSQNQRCITLRHEESWLLPIKTEGPDIWSMNRTPVASQEINSWIKKYELWDKMTLFSERIRDRHLRWWRHKDDIPLKNVGELFKGRKFAKSLGVDVPKVFKFLPSVKEIPEFKEIGDEFVIKPYLGFSNSNPYYLKNGHDLSTNEIKTREEIVGALNKQAIGESRMIAIEELLISCDQNEKIPHEYRFYVFGNRIAFCQVLGTKNQMSLKGKAEWFFDENFVPINFQIMENQLQTTTQLMKPDCWEDLVHVCKKLGSELNRFTRIDLYATNRGAVFGRFVSTPHGGRGFTKIADKWLGDFWKGIEGNGPLNQGKELNN